MQLGRVAGGHPKPISLDLNSAPRSRQIVIQLRIGEDDAGGGEGHEAPKGDAPRLADAPAVLKRSVTRVWTDGGERAFWILLRRLVKDWDEYQVIVMPETVIRCQGSVLLPPREPRNPPRLGGQSSPAPGISGIR